MTSPAGESQYDATYDRKATPLPAGWLSRWPWATFLLPMIVYMVVGSFEPKPPASSQSSTATEAQQAEQTIPLPSWGDGLFEPDMGQGGLVLPIRYSFYPWVYTAKIVLTLLAMLLVWRGYRAFSGRISGLSIVVGVVGVVLWIGICHLQLEPKLLGPVDRFLGGFIPGWEPDAIPSIGLMDLIGAGERSAYNPLKHLAAAPFWAYAFLIVRFFGLAVVVPVIEEFFLRGFLMRYVLHPHWWNVPFGSVDRTAVVVGTAIPMLMHPGELLAALVWFSMVTWLMIRTRNIWDCVAAHAITNFLLGVYVVIWNQWQLM